MSKVISILIRFPRKETLVVSLNDPAEDEVL